MEDVTPPTTIVPAKPARRTQRSMVRLAAPRITNDLRSKKNLVDAGSLSCLPFEVLHCIMRFLSIRDLYYRLSLVNKAFFVIVRSINLQDYTVDMSTALVCPRTKNQRVLLDAISKIANHEQITSIVIGSLDFGCNTWTGLIKLLPNLRRVQFKGTNYVNWLNGKSLNYCTGRCYIESFTWCCTFKYLSSQAFARLFTILGSSLEHLELREKQAGKGWRPDNVFTDPLIEIAKKCPNLKTLTLIGYDNGLINFSPTAINEICTKCQKIELIILRKISRGKPPKIMCQNTHLILSHGTVLSDKSISVLQKSVLDADAK